MINPFKLAAATCRDGTCQTPNANATATAYEMGIARLAGHRSKTRKSATEAMGSRDIHASKAVDIRDLQ
jgi:hypothetical protein